MERTDILELMATLKLYGMRAAYDEVMTTGIKRRHEPPHIVGDLLSAEIAEKQARSIKYQMTIAKLPLAKDTEDFVFDGTPINETLVRNLAGGGFLTHQLSATSFWSAAPGPARRISHRPCPGLLSAMGLAAASSMSSTSPTSSRLFPWQTSRRRRRKGARFPALFWQGQRAACGR